MTGLDLGADWRWEDRLSVSLTAFREVFRDELVSQSAGAGLQAYSFNAPRSVHRGLVAALDWTPATATVRIDTTTQTPLLCVVKPITFRTNTVPAVSNAHCVR